MSGVACIIDLRKKERNLMYVAFDGNYGDDEGLVVVDSSNFDDHFYGYLDDCSDWLRPSYAEWFSGNEHEFEAYDKDEYSCLTCDQWLDEVS
jgi:hypothetical protein